MLAEVVARPHLRKPRAEIIRLTREAREKRIHLCKNVKKLPYVEWEGEASFQS